MTIQAGSYIVVEPSFAEPELLIQYSQASQFIDTLAGHEIRVRIESDDLLVYMKGVNLRTKMAAGTASSNELPGVDISTRQMSTATYLFQVRSEFNHHDVRAGARWGISTVEAYRLGMRQANYQLARDACLHGMNPQFGEGLLNAPGATFVNLPADQNGNDTILTYDNGQMAFYLLQLIQQTKTRTNQMGIGRDFTILGPQRSLGPFEYNVVQLVQFQRPGAGTTSTVETLRSVMMDNKDRLTWGYDDTLIGAGSGGTDAIIIVMTEVDVPKAGEINTNVFAGLAPASPVCTTQYADKAAPTDILSPMAGGMTDFMQEWRLTSGWPVRSAALTILSVVY